MKAVKNPYYPQQATPYNTPQHPCLSSTTLECHSLHPHSSAALERDSLHPHSSVALECHSLHPHSSAALECHRSRHLTAVRPWNAIYPSISSTAWPKNLPKSTQLLSDKKFFGWTDRQGYQQYSCTFFRKCGYKYCIPYMTEIMK